MFKPRILVAAATVTAGVTLGYAGIADAHANAVTCVDQATSTWRITNDHSTSETFTSTEGPSGSVAAGNGSFTDVVWNGDELHVTGTWSDGFVGSTTGVGDCSPEVQPTTTTIEPTTTTLVTTTTAQETTTSTTIGTTIPSSSTSEPTTTAVETSTSSPTSSTLPEFSSTTTTTALSTIPSSVPSTTLPPESSAPTTPPPTSTPLPTTVPSGDCFSTSSTTNPTVTPPVTPCARPSLPATGNPDLVILTGIGLATIITGAFMLTKTRR